MNLRELLAGFEQDIVFCGVEAIDSTYAVVSAVLRSFEDQRREHTIFLIYDDGSWRQHVIYASTTSFCIVDRQTLLSLTPAGVVVTIDLKGWDSAPIDPSGTHFNDLRNAMEITLSRSSALVVGMGRECFVGSPQRGWASLSDLAMTRGPDPAFGFLSAIAESEDSLHAVGIRGEIWFREHGHWYQAPSLTNVRLTRIRRSPNETLLVAGAAGIVLRGRRYQWTSISFPNRQNLWDLCTFGALAYVSSSKAVYSIDANDNVHAVDLSGASTFTGGYLAGTADVLWSVGKSTVARYDGTNVTHLW